MPKKKDDERRVADRIKVAKLASKKMADKMEDMNLTLAETIRRAGAYGLTAAYTTVGAWMLGVEQPRFYDTVALAKVLDLPLEYLADDDADSPAHFKSDLSEQERSIVDIARQVGVEDMRFIAEFVAGLGVAEARKRLFLMTPKPEATNGPPDIKMTPLS
jgi:hypothetical protein